MPHPEWDKVHLRDTIVPAGRPGYGVSALGPVKIHPDGGITPADIGDLYPGADLTEVVKATRCFMDRYHDCEGEKGNCPTLQSVVLCAKHHTETHSQHSYPIEKGSFKCYPPTPKTS